tara:strand:+ start:1515 stop:2102 length:588 start_codon:yes stop_codon:yes gene_type:complete
MLVQCDATMLAAVALAQGKEQSRYYLKGVCFDREYAVATDGHLMTVAKAGVSYGSFDKGAEIPEPVVMPVSTKAITAMKKSAASHVLFDGEMLKVFDDDGAVLYIEQCESIDCTFPNWRGLIPTVEENAECAAAFSNVLLAKLAATATILSSGATIAVNLKGKDALSPHKVMYGNGQLRDYGEDIYSIVMPIKVD